MPLTAARAQHLPGALASLQTFPFEPGEAPGNPKMRVRRWGQLSVCRALPIAAAAPLWTDAIPKDLGTLSSIPAPRASPARAGSFGLSSEPSTAIRDPPAGFALPAEGLAQSGGGIL